MNARTPFFRESTIAIAILALGHGLTGCSNSNTEPENSVAYAASGGMPTDPTAEESKAEIGKATPPPEETQPPNETFPELGSNELTLSREQGDSSPNNAIPLMEVATTPATQAPGRQANAESAAAPFSLADSEASTVPQRELRADLSPEQLVEFLSGADLDIQTIVTGRSGIRDPKEARDTLLRIVKMKLEASRRLAKHANADARAKSEGQRGELQSLSHLAALGDLKVAEELEELAESNLTSDDPGLVADSRLVLIGFAIESLQNGDREAGNRILFYINQVADSPTKPDVPTLMVMGQARQMLADYGQGDNAREVRDMIIALFGDATDPEVAQLAAQLAGRVQFDAIEKLRASIMEGQTVAEDQWRQATETLIDESADLQTVQYLAGAALELESFSQTELADVTYDVLVARFSEADSATANEVQLAVTAAKARRDVIGKVFAPDLDSIDGSPLSMADFKGKVVIIPFWATGFPESLQLVARLKQIRDAHPDEVGIVGINLDTAGAPVAEFANTNDLGFPSFRAESSPTAEVANPVAARFGMVSMPFTAIVDKEGRVAAINFTGRDLDQTVEALIKP